MHTVVAAKGLSLQTSTAFKIKLFSLKQTTTKRNCLKKSLS